ncbi:HlyD family secretion protein [Stenotrophomonas acidaminiphila]|uniref:HlyD family secretion protein n=1 Tax=Stenotrophomonas acidaminiphila TaxID=128780 RepID=A0A0S1B1G4_9GAMM|nr:HlyD family secretion protein [Stenotrophomonas acidaminiphila]ALJ28903.1 HlyD family secretion protein [Stenotrophomonas acidaminiphila]
MSNTQENPGSGNAQITDASDGEAAAASASASASAPISKYNTPSRTSVVVMVAIALVGLTLILRAWQLWPFTSNHVHTDDAYVRGQVTVLAPQVSGYVTEVLARDFDRVKRGQPLLRIDDRSYRQKVDQAEAALAEARAQLANSVQSQAQNRAQIASAQANLAAGQAERQRTGTELQRYEALAAQQLVSSSDRDKLRASAQAASAGVAQSQAAIRIAEENLTATRVARQGLEARVASARAALELARIDLDNTVVRAPRDGQLSEASVRLGQYVTAGTQLLFLVPDAPWVVANFKEGQTWKMATGQPATFSVDAFQGQHLRGHVEQIAPATGSEFAVLRPDNASGNFTKVVQRLPVRIAIDAGQPLAARLRPGMSVVVDVDTAATPGMGSGRP